MYHVIFSRANFYKMAAHNNSTDRAWSTALSEKSLEVHIIYLLCAETIVMYDKNTKLMYIVSLIKLKVTNNIGIVHLK